MSATLITGLGLVGTSYAQHALKRGETVVFYDIAPRKDFLAQKLGSANVTVVQRDVRDLPSLIETLQKYKCETVIHTAGLIGGKVANPIYTGLQINVMGTINVAEAVRLTGVKRLVQISTFGIYDRRKGEPNPIDEDFRRGPGEPYGNSKVAKELMVEAYQRVFGFELIVLRLANVYGVGHFAGGSGGGEMVQNMAVSAIASCPRPPSTTMRSGRSASSLPRAKRRLSISSIIPKSSPPEEASMVRMRKWR